MKIAHLFTLLVKSVYHTLNALNSPPPAPQNKFVLKILVCHSSRRIHTNIFLYWAYKPPVKTYEISAVSLNQRLQYQFNYF